MRKHALFLACLALLVVLLEVPSQASNTTKYTRGNTYYERMEASQRHLLSTRSKWEVVDFSDSVKNLSPQIMLRASKTQRQLGYMYYYNAIMNDTLAIKCHVDEWYNDGKTVKVSGVFGGIADLTTFIAGGIGVPAAIASGIAANLVYAGIVVFMGAVLKAIVSTNVKANVVEQRIYGVCTSHSGKPMGDLDEARIIYVTSDNKRYAGETFYEGYTTHLWGTGELGRMMFWKVFGVEYTPTSWTGVSD